MARRTSKPSEDDLNIPQSTGAVEFDASPDERGITDDNTSSGAFEMPTQTTFTQGYKPGDVTINYETPGPITVMASFIGDAERKVIEAKHAAVTVKTSEPEEDAQPEAEPEVPSDAAPEPAAEAEVEPASEPVAEPEHPAEGA